MPTRRDVLHTLGAAGLAALARPAAGESRRRLPVACQQYTWFSYYRREGKDWMADPQASLAAFRSTGLRGYEPAVGAQAEIEALGPHLKAHDLWTRSLYVNSTLHEADQAEASIAEALEVARAARPLGVEIVVTNPSPIRWGGPENKTDAQLRVQAEALDRLGAELRALGMTLAYHNHDIEMRESAREFHHMLVATDPENVRLCLDAHWVYRGSGNSQVALFDIVSLYADRIVELHLRQSHDGVWSEVFEPGDVDYPRLAAALYARGLRPHLVLEQAVEEGTPRTMPPTDALTRSLAYVEQVFASTE